MSETHHRQPYDPDGLNVGASSLSHGAVITPSDHFFKRSHAFPPAIDAETWRLEVGGLVSRPARYSLKELLTRFDRREVEATLICAGLRRDEFLTLGPLAGELPWSADAASTGRWRGVSLAEVLRTAGVTREAHHVELVGLDRVERAGQQFGFGGSIDLEKAESGDVLLATHLNGEPLPRDHGFPVRAVVPGWIGARSVKWLGRITAQTQPSTNYFQEKAYRIQREPNPDDPRDVTAGEAMSEVPLNAVILEPRQDALVPAGPVRVRGWAMGSGGRSIRAVEVCHSGATHWIRADILGAPTRWTWTLWEAVVPLSPGNQILVARAVDETGAMPEEIRDTWNVKGYGNNAWHRVRVSVT
ncbi:MAG TPA: sulfite oxidase [Gemmatimonadales bacterium]|nr:sulfite oxidase [Gemmatimonadales bacterium]